MLTRRSLIRSSLGFIAAPAIIRVADLMPVKTAAMKTWEDVGPPVHWYAGDIGFTPENRLVMFDGDVWRMNVTWAVWYGPIRKQNA